MGENIVSQPPLMTPLLEPTGNVSKAWAIWFRDIYNRTSYKGGNAIDEGIKGVLENKEAIENLTAEDIRAIVTNFNYHLSSADNSVQKALETLDELELFKRVKFVLDAGIDVLEGEMSWNTDDKTLDIGLDGGVVLQVGQEIYTLVYNGTGEKIKNGTVVYPVGSFGGRPSVDKAIANTHENIARPVSVATMDIPNKETGFSTAFGKVRGVDTSLLTEGQEAYLSTTVSGAMQSARAAFPDYVIRVGGIVKQDATDGELFVDIDGRVTDTLQNFWNGVFRESFDFTIAVVGGVVVGSLGPSNGHPNMTMIFSDGFATLDTDPVKTINLTPGTDDIPVQNFIYITKSSKVLAVSTVDWPNSEEHIKVADVVLRSASTTDTDGALKNQNWNDHIQDTTTNQGHLSHVTERVRQDNSKWDKGVFASVTIDTIPSPDSIKVAVTAGVVYQLHRQVFDALDMGAGDDIHIVNDSISPYVTVTDLNGQVLDASGVSLANRSFSFVIWGVQNKSGQLNHLMLNLPTASYAKNSPESAVTDALNHSVYSIPKTFQGVGFLIARATFVLQAGGVSWSLFDLEDLRGFEPNTVAGGGAGGGGVTEFTGLTDTEASYVGHAGKAPIVNEAETGLIFDGVPLLLPHFTTTERNAFASPVNGMVIYNTTTSAAEIYSSGAWGAL